MSSKRSTPNNVLALGSESDWKGIRSLRRAAEERAKKKRGNDESVNDGGKDVQAKRSKVIKQHDGTPEPKLAAEDLLDLVSLPTLKKICTEVLQDKTVGSKLREELLSCTQDILTTSRAEVIRERNVIIRTANSAIQDVIDTAYMENKSMCNCDDWPAALFPLLPRIKALNNRGSFAGGPEKAWEALMEVAALCIYEWDGGNLRVYGFGEKDCDDFHDKVDEIMLLICEAQKRNGKVEWLSNGRKEEIRNLQEMAEGDNGPCTYRYQETLGFLKDL